ncbi:hypothetical protein [Amycolatopsis sp. ATCC 39116]|uniref:hypothetical protein n=1 Tax=Amycolatopsis sp. (strain ATCC 39116 / 75iv2) TaxID=385957 RepID=UPI0002625CF5|nr:hypothetical protein [Amycolatopsis sp. ATCC 39116]
MRKPSENRLRVLAEVANGRVKRTGAGWAVCSQPARGSDLSQLRAALELGWIQTGYVPTDPIETVPATLTESGRDILARYWPDWTPQ